MRSQADTPSLGHDYDDNDTAAAAADDEDVDDDDADLDRPLRVVRALERQSNQINCAQMQN